MRKFNNQAVAAVFESYPLPYREALFGLRELILNVADNLTEQIGEIEETLKWGEPSYLPVTPRVGTTVRIAWHASRPDQYGIFFNCKTTLVETFRRKYGDLFVYGGNRSIIFKVDQAVPVMELSECVAMAFTYYLGEGAL